MADLVREDHLDLLRRELLQERITEQNAPRVAQAGKSGVRLLRLLAQVQFIDALIVRLVPCVNFCSRSSRFTSSSRVTL